MFLFADINLLAGGPNWLAWIVLGAIAGFITKKIMGGSEGFIKETILGIVGALIGAFIVGLFFSASLNFVGSLIVAVLGAVALVIGWRAINGGRPSRI
jgi:uncharacterized membrane protein YeaQ/YmgE (transglycosylase-associated protein family)